MRHVELAWISPFAAPPFDELAVVGKFNDTRVGTFTVGDEDVAVFRHSKVGHTIESVLGIVVASDAFLAERHQKLSVRVKLERLHVAAVGDPDMPRRIDT